MMEQSIVFVVYRVSRDIGEEAVRELAGIFLTKDEAEYISKDFWAQIEEVELGKRLI